MAGALVAAGALLPAAAANAQSSVVTGSSQASVQAGWPSGPRCPEKAPPGGQFIRTVQPPYGLPYDLYRVPQPDGSSREVQVYC
jgi:hypothetical protein